MSIASFIDRMDPPRQTVTLVNRTGPELYYEMLADFFEPMNVRVREADLGTDYPENTVLLHDGEEPLAVSPLSELYDSALGTNVDRYATGDHGLEDIETPEVVQALGSVAVPGEQANKYVLIQVSRHVEAMAYKTGSGELYAAFQRLSRLTGERGTRRVYERLAETDLDVHVYGVPDRDPDLPVTVHGDDAEEVRNAWFVVHDGDGNDGWKAALVASHLEGNTYRGFWTFDPDVVDDVLAYLDDGFPESS